MFHAFFLKDEVSEPQSLCNSNLRLHNLPKTMFASDPPPSPVCFESESTPVLVSSSSLVLARLLFTRHEMGTESLELEPARIDFDQAPRRSNRSCFSLESGNEEGDG